MHIICGQVGSRQWDVGEFDSRKTGQNSNGKQNPASEERDAGILSCISLPCVHTLLFQHQCLFPLGSLLVHVAQVLSRPAPGRWAWRDKWPRPREREFSVLLLKLSGKSLFCIDAKLAQDIRIKPTQRIESEEVKRDGFSGSLTETLHPSSHESSELLSYESQEIPFVPNSVSVRICHLQPLLR